MAKHKIPSATAAKTPSDHMIAIGKAGENIKNGHADLVSSMGIEVAETANADGTMTYSGPAWSATVRHK